MLTLIRSLSAPLLSLAFIMLASGLFNTYVSVRLEMEGYSPEEIGMVTSALYLGILIGSFQIDRWISKLGHTRSFIIFAAVLASLSLLQALWIDPWYWSGLRCIGGFCMAGVFIVIESWLLMQSAPNRRGAILSVYLAVLYAALSGGQFLINIGNLDSLIPFILAAALLFLSILPLVISRTDQPQKTDSQRLTFNQLIRISPHGFLGGVVSGMLLAVIYGLLPIYANEIGMSLAQISTFMAVLIFGGFSLQLPLGRIADRGNRRNVLNGVSFITAFLGIVMAWIGSSSFIALYLLAWLFGGFSFTLYPISMAYACERVKEDQLVAATGGFVLSYSIGAVAGPLLAPLMMEWAGSAGIFYFLSSITSLLGLIGLKSSIPAILDE